MIAAHDSYTYLSSTMKLYNTFTGPWRCQSKSIQGQYDSGVRYFDIRVAREVKAGRNMWRPCHGIVDLNQLFTSLKNICAYYESLPGAWYRIILEKGDSEDVEAFRGEINGLWEKYPHLDWVVIKDGWEEIKKTGFRICDYCCPTNSFGKLINFAGYGFSIKKWSDENSPTITPQMISDPKEVYFMEFI